MGGSGSPTSDGTQTPASDDLEDFLRECVTATKFRVGQVSFPGEMRMGVGDSSSYSAVVDVRTEPAPAETAIDAPSPRSEKVTVKCILSARLETIGDGMEVKPATAAEEGGWRTLAFTPDGVIEWVWTVKVLVPEDQTLRLDLVPAMEVEGKAGSPIRSTVSYITNVKVEPTLLEKVGHWFDTQWKIALAIAVAIGSAFLALITFSTQVRDAVRGLFKSKASEAAETAKAPAPTASDQPKKKKKKNKKPKRT